ncbi:MAG: YfhO family protein [Anaerolineae bacterium]|nr:YfhO family protein [Anaerolineae bacterium]
MLEGTAEEEVQLDRAEVSADRARLGGAALAVLALLPFLFYWRLFTPNPVDRASFPHGDFSIQSYAFARYQAQRLLAGELPLWSPGAYSGFPFLADPQSASFYPPRLLLILLAGPLGYPYVALGLEAVLHLSLVAGFTFLLGRRLFRHAGIAFLVALAFTFGGYLISSPGRQLAALESAAWLPLALLAAHAGVSRPRVLNRWTLLCGTSLALSALAGHLQTTVLVTYVVSGYALWRRWSRAGASFVGVSLLLAGGLAAAQLLPSAQYLLLSSQTRWGYDEVAAGLPVQDTVQVLFPGSVSLYSPLYVGMLPLLLAGAALVLRGGVRPVRFWFLVALVALLLSFGDQAFVHSLFYLLVPGWRLFQSQEPVALMVSLPACLLAGYGALALLGRGGASAEERRGYVRAAAGLLWVLGVAAVAFFLGLVRDGWTADSAFYRLLGVAIFAALVTALAWGLLRWWVAASRPEAVFLGLAAAIVAFDLFTVGWRNSLSSDPPQARQQAPGAATAMRADAGREIFRAFNEFALDGNYGVQFGLEDIWGASPLRLARYQELVSSVPWERLWPLLDVRYVATWRPELPLASQIIYQEQVGDETTYVYVHRLLGDYPRAWLVGQAEIVPPEATLERLTEPAFDPWRTALLEEAPPFSLSPEAGAGLVRWQAHEPERLVLFVRATGNSLLVLSEVHYPGWRAWVDGQPTQLLVADHALRAVPVPEGEHRVELRFVPSLWMLGLGVSLVSLAVLAVGLAVLREQNPTTAEASASSPQDQRGSAPLTARSGLIPATGARVL